MVQGGPLKEELDQIIGATPAKDAPKLIRQFSVNVQVETKHTKGQFVEIPVKVNGKTWVLEGVSSREVWEDVIPKLPEVIGSINMVEVVGVFLREV